MRAFPGRASLSRGEIDEYTKFVGIYGAKGLAYIKVNDVTQLNETGPQSRPSSRTSTGGPRRPSSSAPAPIRRPDLLRRRQGQGRQRRLGRPARQARPREGYVNGKAWEPLCRRFPMFEYDGRQALDGLPPSLHQPKDDHVALLASDPGKCSPRPTIWPSTAGKSVAARCVSTAPTSRRPSSPRPSARKEQQAKVRLPARRAQVRRSPSAGSPSASTVS